MSKETKRTIRKMVGMLTFMLATAGLLYAGLILLVYFNQSGMVYFPTRALQATPNQIGLSYEDVWLETRDGVRIHGWYVPKQNAKWTILMLHGNGGNISHRLETLDMNHRLDANTLILDYRGYGLSEGNPTEKGTYLDALAAWDYLTKSRERDSIVIFGRSLGGAVATWLAAEVKPRGLILESTFSSIADMASTHYPYLPVRYLSRFSYDSLVLAPRIDSRTVVLHSPEDEIVPFHLGLKLYNALPERKSFFEMAGGHNTGIQATGDAYVQALRSFLDTL